MATSIDQHAPVFLPGELPSLTEKPGRPQSSGYKELDMTEVILCAKTDARFFACGSSAPVRVESEGGPAAWLVGALVVPSVQGHRTASAAGVMALSESFQASCSW